MIEKLKERKQTVVDALVGALVATFESVSDRANFREFALKSRFLYSCTDTMRTLLPGLDC